MLLFTTKSHTGTSAEVVLPILDAKVHNYTEMTKYFLNFHLPKLTL